MGRPDILKKDLTVSPSSFVVVELKDNVTLVKRLEPDDLIFKGYLNQLLYHLVLTDIENVILCIKYSTPELICTSGIAKGIIISNPSKVRLLVLNPGQDNYHLTIL